MAALRVGALLGGSSARSQTAEHTLQPGLAGALVFLVALLAGSIGLAWDIQWHVWVGRDTFWSPPHLLLYAGVTIASALCFGHVTVAWRQRARPARGYAIGAAGMLITLLAAPFDDLWHRLYGIDVDLWAPAHLMGLIGAAVASVGLVMVWTDLRRPAAPRTWGGPTWGLLFVLSGLLALLLTMAQPALNRYPTFDIGALRLLSLPILQAAALTGVLVYAARTIGRPGAALATFGLYWLRQILLALLVPSLIHLLVAAQDLSYRVPGGPAASLAALLSPLLLLPAALAVEVAWWTGRHWQDHQRAMLAGLLVAIAQLAVAPSMMALAARSLGGLAVVAPEVVGQPGAGASALSAWPAAVPAALAAGILLGLVSERWAARCTATA